MVHMSAFTELYSSTIQRPKARLLTNTFCVTELLLSHDLQPLNSCLSGLIIALFLQRNLNDFVLVLIQNGLTSSQVMYVKLKGS